MSNVVGSLENYGDNTFLLDVYYISCRLAEGWHKFEIF